MRIGLLFDDVDARPAATLDECGVLEAVDAVTDALATLGHEPIHVRVGTRPASWLARLEDAAVDVVFNLCEGVGGSSAFEPHVAALVELLGLPTTGSSAETLALARRKDRVNSILRTAGIRVPAWVTTSTYDDLSAWSSFPAIVKPAAEDASIGITQRSVVCDRGELYAALDSARAHGPLLVQQFVPGRELNAGIVGGRLLPLAEIDFTAVPAGAWPIVSYSAKWETGSAEDVGTVPLCPAPLPAEQAERVATTALAAWRAVGGSGHGRVDLRLLEDGSPAVLEVNPNPDLSPSAGLARMARVYGWDHETLIERVLMDALAKRGTGHGGVSRQQSTPATVG